MSTLLESVKMGCRALQIPLSANFERYLPIRIRVQRAFSAAACSPRLALSADEQVPSGFEVLRRTAYSEGFPSSRRQEASHSYIPSRQTDEKQILPCVPVLHPKVLSRPIGTWLPSAKSVMRALLSCRGLRKQCVHSHFPPPALLPRSHAFTIILTCRRTVSIARVDCRMVTLLSPSYQHYINGFPSFLLVALSKHVRRIKLMSLKGPGPWRRYMSAVKGTISASRATRCRE